jgi:hypothetical protein
MDMYPEIGPVEVGEWVRYESSGDPDHHFVQVAAMTKKLIYVDGFTGFGVGPNGRVAFSREHGALFEVGCYDAYAGRLRKLTDADRAEMVERGIGQ